jgi:RNA polymerase sigma-70 factor (ECF subfamily)
VIAADARGAWTELTARLRPFIARRVSADSDADDVLQDVFLRMQRSLGSLRQEDAFGPWVYRVARSAIAEHHRARARHPVSDAAPADAPTDDDAAGVVERELSACVAPFVARLASPYREAVTLTELEGMTQKDAAAMVGISLSGMKSRVQRGREQLRQMFEECCKIALDARGHVIACEPRGGCGTDGNGCK